MESWKTWTGPGTQECGNTTRSTVKEDSTIHQTTTRKERSTTERSKTTWSMAMEPWHLPTSESTLEISCKEPLRGVARWHTQTAQSTSVASSTDSDTARDARRQQTERSVRHGRMTSQPKTLKTKKKWMLSKNSNKASVRAIEELASIWIWKSETDRYLVSIPFYCSLPWFNIVSIQKKGSQIALD